MKKNLDDKRKRIQFNKKKNDLVWAGWRGNGRLISEKESSNFSYSQKINKDNYKISGTVKSNGDEIPFATVSIKNTSNGTVCDENGKFVLNSKKEKSQIKIKEGFLIVAIFWFVLSLLIFIFFERFSLTAIISSLLIG